MRQGKRIVGIIAVMLLSLMVANVFLQPIHGAVVNSIGGSFIPSQINSTQISSASPQTSGPYGCIIGQPETTVTAVYADVALDAIGMGSNSFNNWMGLGAVYDTGSGSSTVEYNVAEVGIQVDYNNGWGTPFLYLTTWWGGYQVNVEHQDYSPSGLALGQTIEVAAAQDNSNWTAWYNFNPGNANTWHMFASRICGFSSTTFVYSSCESTIASGIQNNIFGQWSNVQYQQNNGPCYTVYFENTPYLNPYANSFNHFAPEDYLNNDAWFGEYTATG